MPTARLTSLVRTLALSGVLAASLAACGGDDGGTLSPIDGSVTIDAGVDTAIDAPVSTATTDLAHAGASPATRPSGGRALTLNEKWAHHSTSVQDGPKGDSR